MDFQDERQMLVELREFMVEKGFRAPDPELDIRADTIRIFLGYRSECDPVVGKYFHDGETFSEAFQKAWAAIQSIPDAKERGLDRYRKSLAETLRVAHEESIDDALVHPVHEAFTATTEALLPAPEAAE